VDGEMRFACVDGPEFDAHKVDFAELRNRLEQFHGQERAELERFKKQFEVAGG
jgi:ferredoxin--NADP+ reductase